MGLPVVTVAAGGLPVVEATFGTPVTEAANGRGVAVTKVVGKPGLPVRFETIGVAPPFSPLTGLTGVIGWWDASVTASLTLTGDNIDGVADQSGLGNALVWGGYNKPKYSATALNGRPAFNMNAVSQAGCLQKTGFAMGTGNTLTGWGVCALLDPTNHFGAVAGRLLAYAAPSAGDVNDSRSWALLRNSSFDDKIELAHFNVSTVASWTSITPHRVIWTINSSGLMTIYIDGVVTTIGTAGTATGNWVNGGTISIGRAASGSDNFWDGPIGECGVATGYSDATTVAALDTYLKNKWGL